MNTKPAAAEYEQVLRLRLAKGEPMNPLPISPAETLVEFVAHWMETYVRSNNKPSEQRTKRIILDRHLLPALGSNALADIGSQTAEVYKASKLAQGLHPKTVNNHLTILAKCLRTAEEWGRLARAPRIRLLRAPAPDVDFLLPEESARLLADRAEPAWNGMVLVALRAGLRLGELLALERRDADLSRGQLTVSRSVVNGVFGSPKSNRVRHVPMTAELSEFFAHASRSGLLFARKDGSPYSDHCMAARALHRICRRAGVRPIGWHTLRHTFASDLIAAGVSIPEAQALLGHASIATTMRYVHLAPSALRCAIESLERFTQRAHSPESGQPAGNVLREASAETATLAAP